MNPAVSTAEVVPLPRGAGAVFWILLFGFAATAAYWIVWFFVDRELLASAHTASYYAFENAFPAADAWMALCALLGAISLKRRRASALLFCLAAGSASLYLAGMDILFDLENGIYRAPTGDWGGVVVEMVINLATLFIGAVVLVWAWRNRRGLAALAGW
jgi:hypothetical protein